MKKETVRMLLLVAAAFNLLWAGLFTYYAIELNGPAAAGMVMFVILFLASAGLSFHRARQVYR